MSNTRDSETINTESDLQQLKPLLAKQHDNYREMLQEPIDNSISATVENELYYDDPESFTIQLDFERTSETCRVIVSDAGCGMSREVIRDYVFSTGDTNYSDGILNNIGAGLKASICWCEESLSSAQGPSGYDNRFHVLSREPGEDQYQRVDGPVERGIEVYSSDDTELWAEGADELPQTNHGTRVHLTCAVQDFNEGVAPRATNLETKMRYLQEELGVRFQHLLNAHEDNSIIITYRDIEDDEVVDENTIEVIPIEPRFKAKPQEIDVDEITEYDSFTEFEEAVAGISMDDIGPEQYGWDTTTISFDNTGEIFYVSYEYGELDLDLMFDETDAEERNLKITSPNTKGFRWRYKRNQDGTGIDVYGNGRILNSSEWAFDLTYNNQYNGYCGMLRVIPADPEEYELPTTNDKTGVEKSSDLWQELSEWLNASRRTPVATYEEGGSSGGSSGGGSGGSSGGSGGGSSGGSSGGSGGGSSGGSSGGSGGGSSGGADGGSVEEGNLGNRIKTVISKVRDRGGENLQTGSEVEEVTIDLISQHPGAGDVLHVIVDDDATPEDIYRAMLYQDHYKRTSEDYEGAVIWATDASEITQRDIESINSRDDEHGETYSIQLNID